MLRALYSSSAGMQSQQVNLDVIANNLANVNTSGYKKTKIEFQDLLYQNVRNAGAESGAGNQVPTGLQVGHGSRVVATSKIFTTGELSATGERLDVAIQGDGFYEVQLPDGSRAYTRDGALKTASDGRIVTSDGLPVQGGWQPVQPGTTAINISANGEVTTTGSSGKQTFKVQLVRFNNPSGLEAMGRNLYRETTASGTAETGNPGENGFGTLQQGYLELSNVKVVEEMVNLIIAQRAYEINSKAVQAADEMMQMSNNLRR
ncbi:MAG: flagellar basal-body rod protein FlgG [Limisphaerales bacterium]|nr:MAG: flagellar basal-body rod protein FlgG [Limisphaerales bacterium]KAG0507112.1 MAG: flagellar basal-body rod protein FlgG [Limisphaerales bacterium]TXT49316.1 MAG: flagellar basal-body rod protein FlgG [Limisphaerales bacterium]